MPAAVPAVTVRDGLAVLRADALALRTALDDQFVDWALAAGAAPTLYPPLLRVADLDRIDYFANFPHLALLTAGLGREAAEEHYRAGSETSSGTRSETRSGTSSVPAAHLDSAQYALPSAACYNVYLDLAGELVDRAYRVTTLATCFRRESHFDQLRRLLAFSMREIVCVGEREAVLEHVRHYKRRILDYLAALGLPVEVVPATDPFFDPSGSRAIMATLFPVKEELVYGGSLAIASLNVHRNFFGERCAIRLRDGSPAFSSCVAFGLERWLAALDAHFGESPTQLRNRVAAAVGTGL